MPEFDKSRDANTVFNRRSEYLRGGDNETAFYTFHELYPLDQVDLLKEGDDALIEEAIEHFESLEGPVAVDELVDWVEELDGVPMDDENRYGRFAEALERDLMGQPEEGDDLLIEKSVQYFEKLGISVFDLVAKYYSDTQRALRRYSSGS